MALHSGSDVEGTCSRVHACTEPYICHLLEHNLPLQSDQRLTTAFASIRPLEVAIPSEEHAGNLHNFHSVSLITNDTTMTFAHRFHATDLMIAMQLPEAFHTSEMMGCFANFD